jgi:anti-sigma factor RsiW
MKRSTQHAFEPEEIMAYLDGELEARQASALANHLEHCSECGVLAIRLRQISERTLDFQVEPCPSKLEEPIVAALNSSEPNPPEKLKLGTEHKRRPNLRGFAWAAASVATVLIIAALFVPKLMRSRFTANQAKELAYRGSGDVSIDRALVSAGPPPAPPSAARTANSLNSLVTLASPGAASDSIGRFPGLGDRAANSFSVNGQPVSDQQSKLFSNQIEAPELRGPMIVQTASITILASNYDQASGAIERITAQHRGYVQDMTADTRTGEARSVSATLRVPEKQLEAFLGDLRKLGHVEQETRHNQEITDQYIDLTARLSTARATEQRIIELLGTRTGKLSDVLEAERELARIRGEIESMDGQRANMEHQVRYATVQVQLNEEYREQLNPQTFSTGTRVRNSLIDGFRNLAGGVVSLLIFLFGYGPSILFWLALVSTPAWFAWRRYRRPKAA